MYALLLTIIYIAFISLGLPDSLVGSGWPVMQRDLGVPLSYAGIITMTISVGTIFSSLMSDRLTKRFGTGMITAVSVLTTAIALYGFSISNHFYLLVLWAIPYGMGAGAVDAALNNYVALYYASRHMNWLHAFWGVGAAISPNIMAYYLLDASGWQGGYRAIAIIQIILTACLFLSLPLWKANGLQETLDQTEVKPFKETLRLKGLSFMLVTFLAYSAVEQTTALWATTYLVEGRGIDVETAARYGALFFVGITAGRFLSGGVTHWFNDRQLIRIGLTVLCGGVVLILIPTDIQIFSLIGLVIVGFGCAPIYPAIIHATPTNFGAVNSQAVIGLQMAGAYVGSTFMPPLFGLLANNISVTIFPFYLAFFALLMVVMSERFNRTMKNK
ncbi:sugar MFS transporter [Jeotgalibaca porci]|uniref:MFS transporter n=2 Tax=Jeotgalibaca porci TaxID=1868793 RepID=UPI00359FD640